MLGSGNDSNTYPSGRPISEYAMGNLTDFVARVIARENKPHYIGDNDEKNERCWPGNWVVSVPFAIQQSCVTQRCFLLVLVAKLNNSDSAVASVTATTAQPSPNEQRSRGAGRSGWTREGGAKAPGGETRTFNRRPAPPGGSTAFSSKAISLSIGLR